jgi:hypothetical protein
LALCFSVAVVAHEPCQCFPYADKHWFGRSGNIESTAIVDTVLLTYGVPKMRGLLDGVGRYRVNHGFSGHVETGRT